MRYERVVIVLVADLIVALSDGGRGRIGRLVALATLARGVALHQAKVLAILALEEGIEALNGIRRARLGHHGLGAKEAAFWVINVAAPIPVAPVEIIEVGRKRVNGRRRFGPPGRDASRGRAIQ